MTNKSQFDQAAGIPSFRKNSAFSKGEERCQVIQDFNYKSNPDLEEASLFGKLGPGGHAFPISLVDPVHLADSSNSMDESVRR